MVGGFLRSSLMVVEVVEVGRILGLAKPMVELPVES